MKVISLTWPAWMYLLIVEVLISSYPPLGARYCSASRTPTTASTIHSQGPLKMRFTDFFRQTIQMKS